jgi:hypothetical protein
MGAAVALGGGSLPNLSASTDPELLAGLTKMKPDEQGLHDDNGARVTFENGRLVWHKPH